MKILALVLTTTASLAAAVVWLFFMIIGMNGFHENDASWGLGAYLILAVLISLLAGAAAYFLTAKLLSREVHAAAALLASVPVFTIVAAGLEFIAVIIGIMIADFVRTRF